MQLPNMVIAGAQRCGTSTLAASLRSHPQVFMTRKKELHYFDRPTRMTLDDYQGHFTPSPGQVVVGEATPLYMYDEPARRLLAQTLPDARIIVILRDPVKRAYSHYWHERRRGTEPLETFEEALAAEPARLESSRLYVRARYSYLDRGRYVSQLEGLAQGHGRDNLHVVLLDDLVGDPVPTLASLLEFLGLDPSSSDELTVTRKNRYWAQDDKGRSGPAEYPPMDPRTRAALVDQLREDNQRLATWWGRDLSAWNAV